MKVAVIGAGIWGACSAYHLQKEGADIELYDILINEKPVVHTL